jgi:hypothetical protein
MVCGWDDVLACMTCFLLMPKVVDAAVESYEKCTGKRGAQDAVEEDLREAAKALEEASEAIVLLLADLPDLLWDTKYRE